MCAAAIFSIIRKKETKMFSKTKKLVGIALAAVMTASVVTGCGGAASSTATTASGSSSSGTAKTASEIMKDPALAIGDEDNISLKVWAANDAKDLFEKQCQDFIKLFPDKKIDITVEVQGEDDAKAAVMKDPDAAGDVFGIPSDQFYQLAAGGYLAKDRTQFADDIKSTNLQGAVDVVTYKDNLYAYPETADNGYVLFYDKSVLSEDDVKTMEGLMAGCQKANKKFVADFGNGFYSCIVPFTGGGTIDTKEVEEDGATEIYQVLNYDYSKIGPVAKAFSSLLAGNEYYQNDNPNTVLASGFKNGTHCAGIVGPWQTTAIKNALGDNYGVAKLPTLNVNGEDKQLISMHGYKMLCVNAKTKYPITAASLAYYLSSSTCQEARIKELGWGPSIQSLVDSDLVKNDATLSAIFEQQKYSVPQTKLTTAFWNPTGAYGAYLVNGDKSHDDATLQDEYNTMVEVVEAG